MEIIANSEDSTWVKPELLVNGLNITQHLDIGSTTDGTAITTLS